MPTSSLMDARLQQLEHQGYTVVPGAIPTADLKAMRRRFDELIADFGSIPSAVRTPDTDSIDINRLLEVDPVFASLIDLPSVLPYVEKLHDGDVRLLGASMANFMPAHSPARCGWHQDGGPYTRLTFLLSDLGDDGGPTAVVPGTHREGKALPAWCNDEKGQPRALPGMVKVTGKAGDCMINNTFIWHTSTPNSSAEPRRIVWVVYKREAQAMPPASQYNLLHTPEYLARQSDPRRRRLIEMAVVPEGA
ncbi:MAG: phytanoyl-CoA dioxygenase family protein [Planctomycetota bacterium]|nr:phytanoyl-CoA dioxygenase family protein [Planctomycetota bacterium]